MAELTACLFFDKSGMHYDATNPKLFTNDRFVLSKGNYILEKSIKILGHAAPILWAAWSQAGYIKKEDLLNLRKIDSDLEGHPTPKMPMVDVATG